MDSPSVVPPTLVKDQDQLVNASKSMTPSTMFAEDVQTVKFLEMFQMVFKPTDVP